MESTSISTPEHSDTMGPSLESCSNFCLPSSCVLQLRSRDSRHFRASRASLWWWHYGVGVFPPGQGPLGPSLLHPREMAGNGGRGAEQKGSFFAVTPSWPDLRSYAWSQMANLSLLHVTQLLQALLDSVGLPGLPAPASLRQHLTNGWNTAQSLLVL